MAAIRSIPTSIARPVRRCVVRSVIVAHATRGVFIHHRPGQIQRAPLQGRAGLLHQPGQDGTFLPGHTAKKSCHGKTGYLPLGGRLIDDALDHRLYFPHVQGSTVTFFSNNVLNQHGRALFASRESVPDVVHLVNL